jgi:hypothetical protein
MFECNFGDQWDRFNTYEGDNFLTMFEIEFQATSLNSSLRSEEPRTIIHDRGTESKEVTACGECEYQDAEQLSMSHVRLSHRQRMLNQEFRGVTLLRSLV